MPERRFRRYFRLPWRHTRQVLDDIESELRFHLEMRTRELVAAGFTSEGARREAERQFGDLSFTKRYMRRMDMGHARERRRAEWIGELRQDARYAVRTLVQAPGFAAVAILTLALGIGANTAIFSVVNGVLLRPLAFPHPERLLRVWSANPADGSAQASVSPVDLDDWRAQRSALADIGGYWYQSGGSGIDLTGLGEPQRLSTAFVTPGFFTTLGTPAQLGRLPRDQELVRGGSDRVVLLSHGFWAREFGSAASVLGRTLTLGNAPYVVIGVMPESFRFPASDVEVYVPYSTIPDDAIPRLRMVRVLDAIARMKPGVTVPRAAAEMSAITARLGQQYPEDKNWNGATVMPLRDAIVGEVRTSLLVLLGAVAFVLLMACVNVASLLLARATVRQRELAVRVALGAGQGRLVRQLLTESMVLALAGGAIGLVIARAGAGLLVSLGAGQLPRSDDVHLDGTVVLFSLAVSIVTGLVFGLAPAFRASRPDLQETLRDGARGATSGAGMTMRNGLVVAEVALAVVLVVGAGLMTKSFMTLLRVDPGFRPDHLLVVNFTIPTERYTTDGAVGNYYTGVIDRVRAVPGVISAGAIKDAPFRGTGERFGFLPEGMTVDGNGEAPTANALWVSDGFFRAMGIPLLAGREFNRDDAADKPLVFIVNQTLARTYFPNESPVGKTITVHEKPRMIVGMVGDVRQAAMAEPAKPTLYIHALQNMRVRMNLVVRTVGEPLAMTRRVEEAIWSVDKNQPITSVFTAYEAVSEAVSRPRLLTVLLGLFGTIGLLLGILGLYGVLSYAVNQRRREIGVRIALGAQAGDVLRMVVTRGLILTGAGVVLGVAGALTLTRFMGGVLYGVAPTDPITFVAVSLALLVVAAMASYLPARRATHVDPAIALRYD